MSNNRKYLILGAILLYILVIGFIVVRVNDASSEENIGPYDTSDSDDTMGPLARGIWLKKRGRSFD